MEGEALEYRYGDKASDRVVQPEGQLSKAAMKRKNELFEYGDEPSAHVVQPEGQDTKDGFVANAHRYPDMPSAKQPEGQEEKSKFEAKAHRYPATRSARQVEEFLGKK